MNFLQELKKFIVRGNLVDLAVGFTVGAAFTTVAKSVVGDLVMPVVGLAIGRVDFKDLFVVLRPGASGDQFPTVDAAQQDGAVTLNYGLFINNVIALLFVGLVVFLIVRLINRIHDGYKDDDGKDDARPAEPDNKKCRYCRSTIHYRATRCPCCTAKLSPPPELAEELARESAA